MDLQNNEAGTCCEQARPYTNAALLESNHSKKPPLKWRRVLLALAEGKSFNRFEAERQLSDHCLHTTVSTIQSKGVPVARKFEKVPGYQGIPTECCRYWLTPESRQKAFVVLDIPDCQPTTENPSTAILARSVDTDERRAI